VPWKGKGKGEDADRSESEPGGTFGPEVSFCDFMIRRLHAELKRSSKNMVVSQPGERPIRAKSSEVNADPKQRYTSPVISGQINSSLKGPQKTF